MGRALPVGPAAIASAVPGPGTCSNAPEMRGHYEDAARTGQERSALGSLDGQAHEFNCSDD